MIIGNVSRKFQLAAFSMVSGTAALFFGKMGGGEYVALVLAILGAYGAANVMAARNGK